MKLFILGIMAVQLAVAGEWVMWGEGEFYSRNRGRILDEMANIPEIQASMDFPVSLIRSLYINEKMYEYLGESSCPENDPRVYASTTTFKVCKRKSSYCISGTTIMPDGDPCL